MFGQFFQARLASKYGAATLAGSGKAFEQRAAKCAAKNEHSAKPTADGDAGTVKREGETSSSETVGYRPGASLHLATSLFCRAIGQGNDS